jgi:hypothetical protein
LSFFIRDSLARVIFPAFRLLGKLHSLRFIRIFKRRAKAWPSNKGKHLGFKRGWKNALARRIGATDSRDTDATSRVQDRASVLIDFRSSQNRFCTW